MISTWGKPAAASGSDEASHASTPRRVALVVAMCLWVFAIPVLGFATAAFLAFLILARVACFEVMGPKRLAIEAVAGVAIVGGLYLLMAQVLLIRMPTGLLF